MSNTKLKYIRNISSYILFTGILFIQPLLIKKNHFELTNFKADLFIVISAIFVLSFIIELLAKRVTVRFNVFTGILISFLAVVFISSFISSQTFKESLLGSNGWRIGLLAITFALLIIVFVSSNMVDLNFFKYILIVSNFLVYILGIIDCSNPSISNLYLMIDHRLYFSYISTIGNVNWMVGYLCLTLPLLFMLYLKEEKRITKIVLLVVSSLGLLNCVITSSDGVYLGFGFAGIFAADYIFSNKEHVKDTCPILFAFSFELFVFRYSGLFSEKILNIDGISAVILNPLIIAAVFIVSGFLYLVYANREQKQLDVLSKILKYTMITVLLLCFVYVLYDLYTAARTFDFSWGNNRGYVWYYSRIAFDIFTPLEKLFGIGPENLKGWYYELSQQLKANYSVSHSEPVQILLSYGIAGLVTWFASWAYIFIFYFRNRKKNTNITVFFIPLVAYFMQSFVNSATTTNIAVLTVIVGLYINRLILKQSTNCHLFH